MILVLGMRGGGVIQAQLPNLKVMASKYVSYSVGIRTSAKVVYWISGLRPMRLFKTGEKIGKGEPLGKMSYCDTAFATPHIKISCDIGNKVADPMKVFGIPSTFVGFNSVLDYSTHRHSIVDLQKAFLVMRDGLEDAHAGLYDYTSKVIMDRLFRIAQSRITKPMTSEEFRNLIAPIVASIHDSHTSVYPTAYSNEAAFAPEVSLAYIQNKLVITDSKSKHANLVGKRVLKINNQPVAEYVKALRAQLPWCDGYNQLRIDRALASDFLRWSSRLAIPSSASILKLALEDGRVLSFPYLPIKSDTTAANETEAGFTTKMINQNIACLCIKTFILNQVEEDSIQQFIQRVERSKVQNLIVDVQNNRGGEEMVLERLTTYFINKPYRSYCYKMVKSKTTYPSLKDSQNYDSSMVLFGDFHAIAGKSNFYYENTAQVNPDSTSHFSGKLYVLANEYSVSAASEFAAVMMEQGVATVVGRETGSCYYQMNAEKFAEYRLGNTGLTLRVPLVKIVGRTTVHPRIPFGHGVVPNVEVPMTLEEFTQPKDVVLERALDVIRQSNGLSVQ